MLKTMLMWTLQKQQLKALKVITRHLSEKTQIYWCYYYFTILHDIHLYTSLFRAELSLKLLFLHAFSGCDSTSSIYGISNATIVNKLIENESLHQDVATIFCSDNLSKDQVISAGETAMVIISNGTPDQTLNSIRYRRLI